MTPIELKLADQAFKAFQPMQPSDIRDTRAKRTNDAFEVHAVTPTRRYTLVIPRGEDTKCATLVVYALDRRRSGAHWIGVGTIDTDTPFEAYDRDGRERSRVSVFERVTVEIDLDDETSPLSLFAFDLRIRMEESPELYLGKVATREALLATFLTEDQP